VNKSVRLTVIALDEAKALHCVEELDRSSPVLTRQLPLRCATAIAAAISTASISATITTAKAAAFRPITRRRAIRNGQNFTVNHKVRCRNPATTVNQCKFKGLSLGKASQPGLLDSRNVNENVFTAIFTRDKAEALLSVEEFNDARAFADNLRRHLRSGRATKAASCAATATAETITTASAAAKSVAAATAAKAVTATASATKTAVKVIVAKTVALVTATSAALAAAPSIKSHAE
jgi:hypothetical protein